MSHLRCPVCGKDTAVSSFNPGKLDRDIYVRQAIGLGYRRGFTFGPGVSVLGDNTYTPMVMDRCIDLLKLFVEKDITSLQEIAVELKRGVPIQGIDKVALYKDVMNVYHKMNEERKKQISSLENQVQFQVILSKFEELKRSYDKLVSDIEVKRENDNILKFLHSNLDSKIVLNDDEWILEIYNFDPSMYIYLCKKLYTLNKNQRNLIENRIITQCVEFQHIFWIFRKEPTIRSVLDILEKKPGIFYYMLHNLPIPDYCKGNFWSLPGYEWETFSKPLS